MTRMRFVKTLMALVATAAVLWGPLASAQPAEGPAAARKAPASKAHVLSREELDNLLADPQHVLLIDVRRPDEITSIGGFPVYLSIQLKDLKASLAWIPRDKTLVTVSNHAARAGRAADILTDAGFKVAGAAGAQTYEKAGGTLTHIVAPPPRKNGGQARQSD